MKPSTAFWSILRSIRNGYIWITSGFPRIVFFIFALCIGTAVAIIALRNLGGGFFGELGVLSVGGILTLRFCFKAGKLISEEENGSNR